MKRVVTPRTGPGAVVFETFTASIMIKVILGGKSQNVYIPNGQWADACNAVRDVELHIKRRASLAREIGQMVNLYGVDEVIEALKAHQSEAQDGE